MHDSVTNEIETVEAVADEIIAAYAGDARATVAALLTANAELEEQVSRLSARVSTGYARGRIAPR